MYLYIFLKISPSAKTGVSRKEQTNFGLNYSVGTNMVSFSFNFLAIAEHVNN